MSCSCSPNTFSITKHLFDWTSVTVTNTKAPHRMRHGRPMPPQTTCECSWAAAVTAGTHQCLQQSANEATVPCKPCDTLCAMLCRNQTCLLRGQQCCSPPQPHSRRPAAFIRQTIWISCFCSSKTQLLLRCCCCCQTQQLLLLLPNSAAAAAARLSSSCCCRCCLLPCCVEDEQLIRP